MNNETTKLFAQFDAAIADCIMVPNEWLPEEMHDNTRGGRTLARLEQMCDERDGMTAHKKLKATKAERTIAARNPSHTDMPYLVVNMADVYAPTP